VLRSAVRQRSLVLLALWISLLLGAALLVWGRVS
jgi:hypothetical protein